MVFQEKNLTLFLLKYLWLDECVSNTHIGLYSNNN